MTVIGKHPTDLLRQVVVRLRRPSPGSADSPPGPPATPSTDATELGMATAEYAVATLAAAGFAGLLLVILRSDQVRQLLQEIIQRALAVG